MKTEVTIQGPKTNSEIVELKDIVLGDWYIVVEYPHSKHFIGAIGIATMTYCDACPVRLVMKILSPKHGLLSNSEFKLKKLSKVNITYEL